MEAVAKHQKKMLTVDPYRHSRHDLHVLCM